MNKSIWVTILEKDEAKGRALFEAIHRYGLGVNGHFWVDDLEKMQWAGAFSEISKPETAVWVVKGTLASFADENTRYGLSMLAVMVQAMKGHGFPIVLLPEGGALDPATLPTPLKGAIVAADDATLMPKLVAKANVPVPKVPVDYHLDIHPLPGLGQWFEIGPSAGHTWAGAIFGVTGGSAGAAPAQTPDTPGAPGTPEAAAQAQPAPAGFLAAEVDAHGVGPRGTVPEKATLEYPMKGVKFTMGDSEFTAWAVKNQLDDTQSYYLRVKGYPSAAAFGAFPEGDEAEMFTVSLK